MTVWVLGGEAALFRFSGTEQVDHGRNLEDLARALYTAKVGWVRELENAGTAAELSYPSSRTLLGYHHRLIHGNNGWIINMAPTADPTSSHPHTSTRTTTALAPLPGWCSSATRTGIPG